MSSKKRPYLLTFDAIGELGIEVRFEIDADDIGARANSSNIGMEIRFPKDVAVNIKAVKKAPKTFELVGHYDCQIVTNCSRCLKDVPLDLSRDFTELVKLSSGKVEEQDDIALFFVDKPEINCSEIVSEIAILSIPYSIVCSEDCKGLCPECGCNLNIDGHKTGCELQSSTSRTAFGDKLFAAAKKT